MNRKGQFSIIAALFVAVILITTVIVTYSTIRNSQVQNQPLLLSAIDETNLAIKQVLGFTAGYYGSILQVTGNQSYANETAMKYLQSGLLNIAAMNPQWGTSFSVNQTNSQLQTYWYTNSSYSTGTLDINYNLTGLGIQGIAYQTSCKLAVNATNDGANQARVDITKDENEPLVDLGAQNFQFYSYWSPNSTWLKISPTSEPLSYANGTYIIDVPTRVDPYSYFVQVEDSRGLIVVASSFSRFVYDLNFTVWNTTAWNPVIPDATWWSPNYLYRSLITITNNAASSLSLGYSVNITLDTASLVSANKMLSNGDDLRIVHWNGFSWVEIDRDIISGTMNTGATQVWFKIQAGIGPSPSATNDYYLYYGNPSAGSPPANKTNVYLWFDDFNRPDEPDMTVEPSYTNTSGGTWSIANGMLINVGADGDPNKLLVKALGTVTNDVEMVVKINVTQFSGGDAGRMGLSSDMDPSGQGYCALFHNDQNSLDLLNDLRSWGTHTTYSWTTNTWYTVKFRVINPSLNEGKVKIWPSTSSEPSTWTVDGNFGGGSTRGYGMIGIAGSRQADVTYFDDFQVRYIVDPEPSAVVGQEEVPLGLPRPYLAPAHVQDTTVTVELLQNGTMRWLGQNLQMTPSAPAKPFPPIPIKAIHVNQTVSGVDSEVPFQIEDWGSDYMIPLGLTSNASVFSDRNMLVFLANPQVSRVTVWWNGSDTATQTPNAYTNRYFSDSGNTLTNGILTLNIVNQDPLTIRSTVEGSSCTSTFWRVNQKASGDHSGQPAWVIANRTGIVREIIHQEPEWDGGVTGCQDFYGHVVITLPANATYFTYQLSMMFLNTSQTRNLGDLCPISVTGLNGQPQIENGLNATSYPIVSNATGLYNASPVWQHHWSQFVQGSKGAGIMFTNDANQKLYTFDSIAGANTGALSVDPSGAIGLTPVTTTPAVFNYSINVAWYGAVVAFDYGTTPIYNNSDQTGLWMLVEHPPVITASTEN